MTHVVPCLEAKTLRFRYGQKNILNAISLTVHSGEIVGLLGPNGAGKTTAFRLLCGQYRTTAGHVFINGEDVSKKTLWQRVRTGLAYLPQEPTVLSALTVEDNLRLGLPQNTRAERADALNNALTHFGLNQLRTARGNQLSGGELRRVELARAFATRPQVMLVDEPFAALDPMASEEVSKFLREFSRKGTGVLLSDHDVGQSLSLCDRIYILSEGQIIFVGSPEQVAQNVRVRDIYLGERLFKT